MRNGSPIKLTTAKGDLKKVEEEIAADLGIYFSDPNRFDRMIAYIYDDRDIYEPEPYDPLRNTLKKRDHWVVDVVFVRQPSMMPAPSTRKKK